MAASGLCFVEWREQFVSKERGKRVVHYYLKDVSGESILAVVGTERSLRHMFYVVAVEFLRAEGAENSVSASYRWRSRREVVNWLTSMLSKQQRHGELPLPASPKLDLLSGFGAACQSRLARNFKGHASDIVWSGVAWTCGKQLMHFPAFCRNGITIAVQSFVFVMAEEENRHVAYLEDMYEDRKGQKKVKVRWFHHIREVQGVITLRNPHPKEVFITPYVQVISVECVDGPAFILNHDHYEKSASVLPEDILQRVYICVRQFKSSRVKTFKLSKLRGYFDQSVFSCLDPDSLEEEELSLGDNVKLGAKRTRSSRGHEMMPDEPSWKRVKYDMTRGLVKHINLESQPWGNPLFKVNEKIEFLCQDSGIRGCWFRCTVLQVSHRRIKIQYEDLKDEDGCGNLEEWILSAFRPALPDSLGMRCSGRPIIRPAFLQHEKDVDFKVGDPVDAWWSDGWWEGVVTGSSDLEDDGYLQVFVPSESLLLKLRRKNVRASRDWIGDRWVDIEANPDILSSLSAFIIPDSNLSVPSTVKKEVKLVDFPIPSSEIPSTAKPNLAEEKYDLEDFAVTPSLPGDIALGAKEDNCGEQPAYVFHVEGVSNSAHDMEKDHNAKDESKGGGDAHHQKIVDAFTRTDLEGSGQKCEAISMEVAAA